MVTQRDANESVTHLEQLVRLIDDVERLKRDPIARRVVLERLKQEIQATQEASRPYPAI